MKNNTNKIGIYILIGCIVLLGAIVPFAAQFILPFFFPDNKIVGAEVWNQYVSIILGIVATITSIVSLVLGFRSEEQSNATERRTRDLLRNIDMRVQLISQKQDQMLQNSLIKDYSEPANTVSVRFGEGKNKSAQEQIN